MEVCSILVACIRSTADYQHIFTSQRDYERSGILLRVPVPCSLKALASFPEVIELVLVYLRDFLLSIRSLSESTRGCQMSDCLREGLDCHWGMRIQCFRSSGRRMKWAYSQDILA